jgi:diguanylate cyclase (GGDEF)-like protein
VLSGRQARFVVDLAAVNGEDRWIHVAVHAMAVTGGAIVMVSDATARVRTQRRLAFEATHDHLTGLANRALLLDRLERLLARSVAETVAVLHIDIDRFKLVNSTLGPLFGDHLLHLTASRVTAVIAPSDCAARVGDDSFVVVAALIGGEAAVMALAEQLLEALSEPVAAQGREVVVRASIGVALSDSGVHRADELLRDADLALGRAKELGGGQVVLAHHAMHTETAQRLEIEQALRLVLDRGELWLEYQPEVSLDTGLVVGAEALLRWDHPTRGLLPPMEFIKIAEEVGAIVAIGEWVLFQACRQAAAWLLPPEDHRDLYVAVNVSAKQLADPRLEEQVARALAASGLPASRLCIEVTETVLLDQLDVACEVLARLRALGVLVALDDFGTGYSSFEYLVRLPLDIIKLDASFIARLASNPSDHAVVETVAALARRLGLQMVAEGVEDQRQRAVLASLGCDIAQGYDLGRPGDSAQFLGVVWRRASETANGNEPQAAPSVRG